MTRKRFFGVVTGLLALSAVPVAARTVPAAAGRALTGSQESTFNTPNGTIYTSFTSGLNSWVMPVAFDFPGARDIAVVGKCPTNGGSLGCSATVMKADGTIASSAQTVPFPKNNTFTTITLHLSSIPSGSYGSVSCQFSGGPTCTLVGIDYDP